RTTAAARPATSITSPATRSHTAACSCVARSRWSLPTTRTAGASRPCIWNPRGNDMGERLIACVLGGTAPGAKTELHDVAFAVGDSLEAVHDQLLDGWFGDPRGLHVDAWCFLDSVAGYRAQLSRTPADNGLHLYFINIGGYRPGVFAEHHAWGFFGAPN